MSSLHLFMYYKCSIVQILLLLLSFFLGGGWRCVFHCWCTGTGTCSIFHFEVCLKTKGKTAVHGCRCSGDVAVCVCVRYLPSSRLVHICHLLLWSLSKLKKTWLLLIHRCQMLLKVSWKLTPTVNKKFCCFNW